MIVIYAGTGHRPNKLGGYSEKVFSRLTDLAAAALNKFKPDMVISGMALGWDQALAAAAIRVNIPFIAALPCEGQDSTWPEPSKLFYKELLDKAEKVQLCGLGGKYAAWKMQYRNKWMVDECTTVLALWDGSSGGTANCIAYAKEVGKPIVNLWTSWEKHKENGS